MWRQAILLATLLAAVHPGATQSPEMLVLRLGWAPLYCLTNNAARTGPFCGGTKEKFNAFRLNRLYGALADGTSLDTCTVPTWDPSLVPQDLMPELGCVWNSYAATNNNDELWASVWGEDANTGACAGLAQDEWMRTAVQLRDQHNLEVALKDAGVSLEGPTISSNDIRVALVSAFGKLPHIQRSRTGELSSVSLCFTPTAPYTLVDCNWGNDAGEMALPQGVPVSAECAQFFPGAVAVSPQAVVASPPPSPDPSPSPSLPSPDQPSPSPSRPSPTTPSPSATPSPSPLPSPPLDVSAAPAGGTPGSSSSSSSSSVPIGAIIGGVVGVLAAVAVAVGVFIYLRRRRQPRLPGSDLDAEDDAQAAKFAMDSLVPSAGSDGGSTSMPPRGGGSTSMPPGGGGSDGAAAFLPQALAATGAIPHNPAADTFLPREQALAATASIPHNPAADTFLPREAQIMQNWAGPPTPAGLPHSMPAPVPQESPMPSGMHTPSLPPASIAAASVGTSTQAAWLSSRSSSQQGMAQDPLMSFIKSQVSVASQGSAISGITRRTPSSAVDMRPWEVPFSELQIIRPIGEGSYGRVYLGTWHETEVAVKVLLLGMTANTPGDAQRALALSSPVLAKLEEEASLLASLRHPHIVNFFGIIHEPPCIITEYCARGSLAELLAAARQDPAAEALLTWPRRLALALDAAVGMLYLHSRGVVHRDLKSANLLVDDNLRAKVTDFNLSKILADTTNSSSMAAMNPRWLAPEVMQGERATQAADVFSYGVCLHELLTWSIPWGATNPWQLVSLVVNGGRLEIPPRDRLPGTDTATFAGLDAYVDLLQRCWAQNPYDRPTFEQVVPALRAMLAGATGAAGAPAPEPPRVMHANQEGMSAAFGDGVVLSAPRASGP